MRKEMYTITSLALVTALVLEACDRYSSGAQPVGAAPTPSSTPLSPEMQAAIATLVAMDSAASRDTEAASFSRALTVMSSATPTSETLPTNTLKPTATVDLEATERSSQINILLSWMGKDVGIQRVGFSDNDQMLIQNVATGVNAGKIYRYEGFQDNECLEGFSNPSMEIDFKDDGSEIATSDQNEIDSSVYDLFVRLPGLKIKMDTNGKYRFFDAQDNEYQAMVTREAGPPPRLIIKFESKDVCPAVAVSPTPTPQKENPPVNPPSNPPPSQPEKGQNPNNGGNRGTGDTGNPGTINNPKGPEG